MDEVPQQGVAWLGCAWIARAEARCFEPTHSPEVALGLRVG